MPPAPPVVAAPRRAILPVKSKSPAMTHADAVFTKSKSSAVVLAEDCAMDEAPPAKRIRYTADLVTICVGVDNDEGDSQSLSVHKDIICSASSFFRAALSKDWEEGRTGVVKLPEDHIDAVALFVDWVYGGCGSRVNAQSNKMKYSGIKTKVNFTHLIRSYVFEEKILDDAFCNAVMSALFGLLPFGPTPARLMCDHTSEHCNHIFPQAADVKISYAGTPPGSPARKLMVNLFVAYGKSGWVQSGQSHPEFLQELAVALIGNQGAERGLAVAKAQDFLEGSVLSRYMKYTDVAKLVAYKDGGASVRTSRKIAGSGRLSVNAAA